MNKNYKKDSSELIYEDALNNSSSSHHHNAGGQNDSKTTTNQHDQERSNTNTNTTTTITITNNKSDQLNRSLGTSNKSANRAAGAHNPPSNVIHITHLTRPFTVNQLKELLVKYGSLKTNEKKQPSEPLFWIDAVKSHCYVAYETQSDAEQARQALHNITWPASNPKQLNVDFSSMDEINDIIENDGAASKPNNNKANTNGDSRDRKVTTIL